MKVGFIGAGKVGCSLGKYFKTHDILVAGYYSKNPSSARAAAEFTGTAYYEQAEALVKDCDLLFLTVPDGEIERAWNKIKKYPLTNKKICHCSGALSSAVFSEIDQCQAFGFSIHPMYAVHSKTESYQALSNAFFTIEGSPEQIQSIHTLLTSLGNQVRVIGREDKVKYHSAAVFVSNHVAALVHLGRNLLTKCGFEEAEAEKALMPLFLGNSRNIAETGVVRALTGPIERNELQTVAKHLDILYGADLELYRLLSLELVKVAEEKHSNLDNSEMKALLNKRNEGIR